MSISETDIWAQLLFNLSRDIDAVISGSGHHSVRVAHWTESLARMLKMTDAEI